MNREKVRHEAIERFTAEWHNGNSAIVEAFEEGAEWMLEQFEEWLRKTGKGQLIGSLNRFLEGKYDR